VRVLPDSPLLATPAELGVVATAWPSGRGRAAAVADSVSRRRRAGRQLRWATGVGEQL